MNNQNVINEVDVSYDSILSVVWKCDNIFSVYSHRDIEVNDYGNPVLRIYNGDSKKLYKELYLGDDQLDNRTIINEAVYSGIEENVRWTYNNSTQKFAVSCSDTITEPITFRIAKEKISAQYDTSNFTTIMEKDLIVVVEPNPHIERLSFDDKVSIDVNSKQNLSLNEENELLNVYATYSNGDVKLENQFLYTLKSYNLVCLTIQKDTNNGVITLTPTNDGISHVGLDLSIYSDEMLEGTIEPEPMLVCTSYEVDDNDVDDVGIRLYYDSSIDTFKSQPVDFHIMMEILPDGETYDITDKFNYTFSPDIATLSNYKITPKKSGHANCYAELKDEHLVDFEFYNIPPISFSINVIEDYVEPENPDLPDPVIPIPNSPDIIKVEFCINKSQIDINESTTLRTLVTYSDNSVKDISEHCTYTYNSDVIKIENNTITGLEYGVSNIKLDKNTAIKDLPQPKLVSITICKPLTKIQIDQDSIDVNIGQSELLTYSYTPKDANVKDLVWSSDNEDIVEIDASGKVTAKSEGSVTISLMEKSFEEDEDIAITGYTDSKGVCKLNNLNITLLQNNSYVSDAFFSYQNKICNIVLPTAYGSVDYTDKFKVTVIDLDGNSVKGLLINLSTNDNSPLSASAVTNSYGEAFICTLSDITTQIDNTSRSLHLDGILINYLSMAITTDATYSHVSANKIIVSLNDNIETLSSSKYLQFRFSGIDSNMRIVVKTPELTLYDGYPGNNVYIKITSLPKITSAEELVTISNNETALIAGCKVHVCYTQEDYVPFINNIQLKQIDNNLIEINIPESISLTSANILNISLYDDSTVVSQANETITEIPVTNMKVRVVVNGSLVYNNTPSSGEISIQSLIVIKDDVDTDVVETSNIIDTCVVNAVKINVTKIINYPDAYRLDLDLSRLSDNEVKLECGVEPSNATNPVLSYKMNSSKYAAIMTDTSSGEKSLWPWNVGEGILTITSVDNPDISVEVPVIVTANRVQDVIITGGNDEDYEWYDNLNEKDINGVRTGQRMTDEKYDDDDFPRFYCPVNNCIQLNADVIPGGANYPQIKWLSSNVGLVKITENGIACPQRWGKQKLDVVNSDGLSETRFANTVWISALNTKYNKYGMAHLRVTENNITAINIDYPESHDYDVDDIDIHGYYDSDSEYAKDYVIHVGETIEIPVNLETVDDAFGPSNTIKYMVGGGHNVVSLSGGKPNRKHLDEDFDWTGVSAEQINNDNKNLTLKVTGENIGDTYFYAVACERQNTSVNSRLYISNGVQIGKTDENGEVEVGDYKVTLRWFDTNNLGMHPADLGINIAEDGLLLSGIEVIRSADNKIVIKLPKDKIKVKIDDLMSVIFVPEIDKSYDENLNKWLKVNVEYIGSGTVDVSKTPIIVSSYYKSGDTYKNRIYLTHTDSNGEFIAPNANITKVKNDSYSTECDIYARPGEGIWLDEDIKSRKVRIRVVATPKKIELAVTNLKSLSFHNFNKISGDYYSCKKSVKERILIVGYDEDFEYLLEEAYDDLAPKYLSFAWFSDNEDVVRFEDVKKEDGTCYGSHVMKAVLEGKGTANIWVMSTMGEVVKKVKFRVK